MCKPPLKAAFLNDIGRWGVWELPGSGETAVRVIAGDCSPAGGSAGSGKADKQEAVPLERPVVGRQKRKEDEQK